MTTGAWRRRCGASLLAGALAVVALGPVSPNPAAAQTGPGLPLTLAVTRIGPTAPQPGDLLTVAVRIANPTGVSYDDVSLGLRIDPTPLLSRAALLAVVASTDHLPDPVGSGLRLPTVAPGAALDYQLTVPVDQLGLRQAGVYRLSVEASHSLDGERVEDARVDTFLPWLPPAAAVPALRVAWLWPLLSAAHLRPDETFATDALSSEIAPRGRLGALVDVATAVGSQTGTVPGERAPVKKGTESADPPPTPVAVRGVPVTPVIDPENVQELQLMAGTAHPYQVALTGGRTSAGTGQAAAAAYLDRLRGLMGRTASLTVPYADPDLEALADADAATLVTQTRSTGLEATLPGVVAGLVWPPEGGLSEGALGQLTTSGLVLSSAALPLVGTTGFTPTAAATVARAGGTVPAVVVDDGLSALVTKQIRAPDRVLIAQRFAAETAAIAVEGLQPTVGSRALVIAPGRRWSPTNSAVRTLLAETGRLPWLTPVTVPQVLQQDRPDPAVERGPLRLPARAAGTSPLSPSTARQIAAANTELAGFRSILCPAARPSTGSASSPSPSAATGGAVACNRDDQVLALQRSLYRTASSALARTGGAEALLAPTLAGLRAAEAKVTIVTKGQVNLLGNRARLPITIVNRLSVPVQVQLVLLARSPGLTTSPAQTLVIPAGSRPQLDVTVNTVKAGAGTLLVDAQLLTPQGNAFGRPVRLKVKVSAYGAVVVTITVAVCSLLGLAVVVRLFRRIRNARRGRGEPGAPAAGQPA